MTYRSFAKINLFLQVVGERSDGYHELRTIFQTIDLHDLLTVELGPQGVDLTAEGEALPTGPENLAHRAAAGFLSRWAPDRGVRLHLHKRIPVAAGLGGGSSNAATVLLALQALLGSPAPPQDLWSVARELGADVPFFLVGGTAFGCGRGDEVVPLPDLPETELWVVTPPVQVPTAQAFASLGDLTAQPLPSSIMAFVQGRTPPALAALLGGNDLQASVLRAYPRVNAVYNALVAASGEWVQLSGSGSAVFASLRDTMSRSDLSSRLPAGSRIERVRTLTRSSVVEHQLVR